MHIAYRHFSLLKLPLTIECILNCADHLFVGTKQGHLLQYTIQGGTTTAAAASSSKDDAKNAEESSPDVSKDPPRVQLLRTNKNFSKKPITQLAAIPEHSVLVVLCNSQLSAHDMDMTVINFPTIHVVERAKGASLFAVDCVRQVTLTGETAVLCRLVVAVKKRLQFYYWKNRQFLELHQEITLPDFPKSLDWCKDSICVGFKSGYSLIKMSQSQEVQELFPNSSSAGPQVTKLSDERFALQKGGQTTFIDLQGNMKLYTVNWGEVPAGIAHDAPYLIGLQSGSVEVRTEDPRLTIQSVPIPEAKFITTHKQGWVYVASQNHIWCLKMEPVSAQVPQLLRDKQFELAVTLSTIGEDSTEEKSLRIQKIKTLSAFDLFCNKQRFKESLNMFLQLNIDPSHVIGLFDSMLPDGFRSEIRYPDRVPSLQGRELENALQALIEYITQLRHKLKGVANNKCLNTTPMVKGSKEVKSKKQMMQILDTTLLKCYLKTNDALVAPLLRLPENQCHLEETEKSLAKCRKFSELVIFYRTRGMHEKALNLLQEHASRRDSPLQGHEQAVLYLQELGAEHIDLIFRHAGWIFEANSDDALTVFAEDLPEVEALPRKQVLNFLLRVNKPSVIPYLEFVIREWSDTTTIFHNTLILQYKNDILDGMGDHRKNNSSNSSSAPSASGDTVDHANSSSTTLNNNRESSNDGRILETRGKLQNLLLTSPHYTAELILPKFPYDCLEEERAILLGSLQRHVEALVLYLYKMRDYPQAMEYCAKHYRPDNHIYSILFELMLQSPEPSLLRQLSIATDTVSPTSLDDVTQLVRKHGKKLDEHTVVEILPQYVPLSTMTRFVRQKLQQKVASKHKFQVKKGLLHAEHLQLLKSRLNEQAVMTAMVDSATCQACQRKIRVNTVFIRSVHTGGLLHFGCKNKL